MTPTELHRWARPIILESLEEANIELDSPVIALAVHGVGWLETGYSTRWKTAGRGSNNWAADQSGRPPCPPATSFLYSDSHPNPDGTSTLYQICFRRYLTPQLGAGGLVRQVLTRRPSVLLAARHGSLYDVSVTLYTTFYYEGVGKTAADRIANHYKALFSSATAAALANGDSLPQPWVPATEPWMHDLSPVHPTLQRGTRHATATKVWQRDVLNHWLQDPLVADGAFGPLTQAATKTWQSVRGLKPDGIVGPLTWDRAEQEFDEAA